MPLENRTSTATPRVMESPFYPPEVDAFIAERDFQDMHFLMWATKQSNGISDVQEMVHRMDPEQGFAGLIEQIAYERYSSRNIDDLLLTVKCLKDRIPAEDFALPIEETRGLLDDYFELLEPLEKNELAIRALEDYCLQDGPHTITEIERAQQIVTTYVLAEDSEGLRTYLRDVAAGFMKLGTPAFVPNALPRDLNEDQVTGWDGAFYLSQLYAQRAANLAKFRAKMGDV